MGVKAMDNGPGVEPTGLDLPDALCYCVDCGTVYVYHFHRDCPACYLDERLDELEGDG